MACATLKRSLDLDPLYSPRPTKRRRCAPVISSPTIPPSRDAVHSPFSEVSSRLTKDSIVSSIREEMRRFQRRKQLHFGDSPSTSSFSPPGSPNSSGSETNVELPSSTSPSSSNISNSSQVHLNKDKPLFTFRQVGLICERMLREREDKLRELYEEALAAKLSEQYDMFVKFTHDQIQKRFEAATAPSYLS